MNWNALKNMKCPKCGIELVAASGGYRCGFGRNTPEQCQFYISKQKFDSIAVSLYKPKSHYATPEDNLSALNNFGHEKVSEDYS